ncbi:MAG: hypothetical protein HOP29_07565, partial [Phycisphaerales bacterium]|nr:hypothetical protein [Phycisphaerales bacterium]
MTTTHQCYPATVRDDVPRVATAARRRVPVPAHVFSVCHSPQSIGRKPGDWRMERAPHLKKPRAGAHGSASGLPVLNRSVPSPRRREQGGRAGLLLIAILLGPSIHAIADGSTTPAATRDLASVVRTAGPAPAFLPGGMNARRLYDNTNMCTPEIHWLAVGGNLNPTPGLALGDWFTTNGGEIVGFDLFVMNGASGAVPNSIGQFQFLQGTDANHLGTPITTPAVAAFRTTGVPALSRVPVHRDPVTGLPRLMRVSVNYMDRTYTVVDAETGTPLITPPFQHIGDRPSFTLPPGKVGVTLRLSDEVSLCRGGHPVCGPALAGGGRGNEDALHIINAEQCPNLDALGALCADGPDWTPGSPDARHPCIGEDRCDLNRPHYGIALTLYAASSEDGNGNNDVSTADAVTLSRPQPPSNCSGSKALLRGYIGDNVQTTFVPTAIFDCRESGDIALANDVNLLDWACLQTCTGQPAAGTCRLFDGNTDGAIDSLDYFRFLSCEASPGSGWCIVNLPLQPFAFEDVDLYRVRNLRPGDILSAYVEGAKSPVIGPLFDPYLRIFRPVGPGAVELDASDDFERFSLDAFTTVKVPDGVDTLFVGVSTPVNADYDPADPFSVEQLPVEDAGEYELTVVATDPACVIDDHGGDAHDCYPGRHEPDDSLTDADARGDADDVLITGIIGDGAFAGLGQDLDIYRLHFTGPLAGARSLTAHVADPGGIGFETVFDLAMALYDGDGRLIATADQASVAGITGLDQSKPQLAANIDGTDGGAGVYYLAIFGTDRGLFDEDDDAIFPASPPSILSFPHGPNLPCTHDSDLSPVIG